MTARAIHLVLPPPPSVNRLWRRVTMPRRGPVMLKSRAARAYAETVLAICRRERIRPYRVPVAVSLAWYRARRHGDLDNVIKALLDSLRGLAYEDDRQVVAIHATRHDAPSTAQVIVTVEPVLGAEDGAYTGNESPTSEAAG